MKILFISTSIVPYPDMQAIRNVYLIQGLLQSHVELTIITPEYKWLSDNIEEDLKSQATIIKTNAPFFLRLERLINKSKFHFLAKVFNVASNYIIFPDLFMFWDIVAYRTITSLYKKNKFDGVISSSGSYTAHFAASRFCSKFKVPWIAEYGDPWGIDIYGRKKNIISYFERKILRKCNGLVFTTQETIEAYKKVIGAKLDMLYAPCGFDHFLEERSNLSDKFTICYTGVAYAGSRNLNFAIAALKGIKFPVNMYIVGSYSTVYKEQAEKLDGKVHFVGRVSYENSLSYICGCDLLVHIGNKGKTQIPGKTYIYLSSTKPILYIRQEEEDPTYDLLKNMQGVIFSLNNEEDIHNALVDIYTNYKYYKTQAEERCSNKLLLDFKWKNISKKFACFTIEHFYMKKENDG